jgi:hypothetical protein
MYVVLIKACCLAITVAGLSGFGENSDGVI